ncbi:PLP-dependent transferase [Aspergillus ellipticus CBS 707.79]|uniref:PLP-dependent transferase n=1 Tax=Aspergillus ellipticus CBS 707.79 TaxID=1448320 RepID=A0A319CQS6_9EURO|nr:PLP-dependent transferase [Aspergillus ellipticus CBS 707.79]
MTICVEESIHVEWPLDPLIKAVIRLFEGTDNDQENGSLQHQHPYKGCCSPELQSTIDHPETLRHRLALNLLQDGQGFEGLRRTCEQLLQHTVNTSSSAILGKLWSALSIPGIGADFILSAINGNEHVGEELDRLFGLGGPHAGGITMPGGATANSTALLIARNVRFLRIKDHGISAAPGPLVIFVSKAAHYSIPNAAQIIGLGAANVRKIPTTAAGQMDPFALEAALQDAVAAGEISLCVCAPPPPAPLSAANCLNRW